MAKVLCRTCRKPFVQAKGKAGGRPAVNCEKCRRDPATRTRPAPEQQAKRKQAQRRAEREGADKRKTRATELNMMRVAAWLSVISDPVRACDAAGVPVENEQAEAFAAAARAAYPGLADAGDRASLVALHRMLKIEAAVQQIERLPDVPPGQLPNVTRAADAAMATDGASDSAPRYTEMSLFVTAPDGQTARVE